MKERVERHYVKNGKAAMLSDIFEEGNRYAPGMNFGYPPMPNFMQSAFHGGIAHPGNPYMYAPGMYPMQNMVYGAFPDQSQFIQTRSGKATHPGEDEGAESGKD